MHMPAFQSDLGFDACVYWFDIHSKGLAIKDSRAKNAKQQVTEWL